MDKKDPAQKGKIGEIKNSADGEAKKIYQGIIEEADIVVNVHVSEGFGRDALNPEDVFQSNERVNPKGTKGREHAIMDVIEGTNSFVTNVDGKRLCKLKDSESGATSIITTGSGIRSLGNCPDGYVHYIGTTVSQERRQEFIDNPLDPELIAKDPTKIEEMLSRISDANGIGIADLEVVLMKRDREKQNLGILTGLQKKYPGLKVVTIEDGTVAHSLEAAFGRKEGKHKVVMTVGGAPEGFFNLAVASLFKDQGALASLRIYSMKVNETAGGDKATDLATRYNFDPNETADIQDLRPNDGEAVLKGERLFTQEDVDGDVEGTMAFITNNGVFGVSGAERLDGGSYKVKVLRFGKIDGKPCEWFEERTVMPSYNAVGFDLASSKLTQGYEIREGARDIKGLFRNIKGILELDAAGNVVVIDANKLRSEAIDYLAKEAALSSDDDVKTAAQFLVRSAAGVIRHYPLINQ